MIKFSKTNEMSGSLYGFIVPSGFQSYQIELMPDKIVEVWVDSGSAV